MARRTTVAALGAFWALLVLTFALELGAYEAPLLIGGLALYMLVLGRGLGDPWPTRLLLVSAAGSLAALLIAGFDSAGAAPDVLAAPYLLITVIAFASLTAAAFLSLWLDRPRRGEGLRHWFGLNAGTRP